MHSTIAVVKEMTQEQTRQLTMALEYIPENQRLWRASGCAKTPQEIYLECAGTYLWAAKFLRGEAADWSQLMPKSQEYSDLASAKQLMDDWLQEFFAAIDGIDESRMGEEIDPGWGDKMPLQQFLLLPSYHTCYHAGQLNYIQTLLGDAEMHF